MGIILLIFFSQISMPGYISPITNYIEEFLEQGIMQKKSASSSRTLPLVKFDQKMLFFQK